MRVTVLLIMVAVFHATASVYSQSAKISLDLKQASLETAFQLLQEQTDYDFFFVAEQLPAGKRVTVNVEDAPIHEVLDQILAGTGLVYRVLNKDIIVTKGSASDDPSFFEVQQKEKTVSGKVSDTNGNPLPGVTVLIKGTGNGTVTDIDGNFSLKNVSPEAVLVFSFVGMKSQELRVKETATFSVTMKEETVGIEEVVAVGYGTMKKSDLTGSVASVRSDQIALMQSSTLEQALTGRASGVHITQSEGAPGAGVKMRIRGGTSINASTDPLYVIDGFPVEASTNRISSGLGITETSILATMNPNDIESIEVLKDASSTAIYGSRGSNGVVIITTKSGGGFKQNISFDAYTGISKITKTIDVLEGQDYVDYYYYLTNISYLGDNRVYALRDENGNPILDHYNFRGDPVWKQAPLSTFQQHNWQDELFRAGKVQNYNLSFYGGSKNLNYLASVGYFNQEGIIIGSEYERYTANLKLENVFSDRFKIGINTNTGYTINDGVLTATTAGKGGSGVITNALVFMPVLGYDVFGTLITDPNSEFNNELSNPVKEATEVDLSSTNYYIRSNLYLDYEILSGLRLKIAAGTNLSMNKNESWYPGHFGYGYSSGGGAAFQSSSNLVEWLNENTLSYMKQLGENHQFNIVAGYTQQGSTIKGYTLKATDFEIQSINLDNMGSATINQSGSGSDKTEWGLKSWLGRINYGFKNKYLLTLTGRADGSSRFPKGRKWAFFPSGAVAWRITEEPFFRDYHTINDLKLHTSYGLSGNQAIDIFSSLAKYRFANYPFDENQTTGLAAERLENNALSWETTRQLDIGLDMGLFNNRIYLTTAYYNKTTDDLLLQVNVPLTTGYPTAWKNAGKVRNYGVEFNINSVNIKKQDFTWSSSLNISFNRNTVKKLYSDLNYFYVSGPGEPASAFIVKEGEAVGSMFGFIFDGVYQLDEFNFTPGKTYEELLSISPANGGYELKQGGLVRVGTTVKPGGIKFKDVNGRDEAGNLTGKPDGKINDDDRTIIGDANPDFFGGFSNEFSYKNFDLSVFFNFSYGNDIYNKNLYPSLAMNVQFRNPMSRSLKKWTVNNPTNELWGTTGLTYGGGDASNSYWVEDGSFLRLSNITLGYNLPKSLISRWNISKARIYLSGDNLMVWTNYSGYDPEVSVGFDNLAPGVDWGAYPRSRSVRVGIKLDF